MLDVKVEGIADVEQTMDRVSAAIRDPKLPRVWQALGKELRTYPAPPPGSKYERTNHLKQSWKIGFSQGNRSASLFEATNSASYAQYVQGDMQARVHQGRWTPASVILAKYEASITREWEQQIEDAAR